jgi:hypothetical protein
MKLTHIGFGLLISLASIAAGAALMFVARVIAGIWGN